MLKLKLIDKLLKEKKQNGKNKKKWIEDRLKQIDKQKNKNKNKQKNKKLNKNKKLKEKETDKLKLNKMKEIGDYMNNRHQM